MTDIQMPQLGETVTEGTITRWFKEVGDQITEDEPLFEVSTDKVDSEVPSPVSGVLSEILVPEGETVDVGAVLARVGEGDGEAAEAAPAAEATAEAAPPAEPEAEPEPQPAEAPPTEAPEREAPPPGEEAPAAPAAPEVPAAEAEAPRAEPAAPPAEAPGVEAPPGRTDGRLLSPVVRRLVAENNLDPDQIEGTGPGGRITRNDVLATIERARAEPAAREAPAAAPAAPEAPPAAREAPAAPAAPPAPAPVARAGERQTSVPHTNIRRRTAEHMIRSKQTSAHVYAMIEVDFERVEQVRRAEKEHWRAAEGFSLTYMPFIARAVVDAVREYPEVNATFGENELVVHNYVNLGIAVDLDFKGLMVPVIRDADGKRLRAIAREATSLAQRARSKQLSPDDISGGTITITNAGPFGTTLTMPIINQPQVAIIATDAVKRRPVVVDLPDGSEGIAVHSVGNLTLTWDHRAFDGAYAASFLNKVKTILETRDWAAELA